VLETPAFLLEKIHQAKERRLKQLDLTNEEFPKGKPGLREIPREVYELEFLESLNLRRNSIASIPASIVRLKSLKSINLSFNGLTKFPTSICQLMNLRSLDLSVNNIKDLPECVSQMDNLTSLDLSYNDVTSIPEAFFGMRNLTYLDLSANRLSVVSPRIAQLEQLKVLRLSNNLLKEIPEGVYALSNLKHLELRSESKTLFVLVRNSIDDGRTEGNQIKEISSRILHMQGLEILGIDSNVSEIPPPEIVSKGIGAIRDYFRQIEAEGRDYLYEAKLLIVGEGGAGKTTLARKIENPAYQLQDEDSTKGIDVLPWTFALEDGQPLRVNIWDFGGQEIYHATHQFFLTKRSLYVLVADSRKEDTDFYYWLNAVELLSDGSPLLIVKNEKQDRRREINERQLRGQFSNLKETLATNLGDNRGLAKIIDEIKHQISHLPHIGAQLPKTWIKVREALEEDSRNHITLDEYLGICERHGFTGPRDQLQLSSYLHDLGVCLHFQEDPLLRKTVILQPNWGTDAVYKVLDNSKVINNLGVFNRDDLADIWREPEYAEMLNELLQLMINFKLCYRIPNSEFYIAPQLLTENQPSYDWDSANNLVLRYTYEFMPKGILIQLIVAMHKLIAEHKFVWRSGVIFERKLAKAEVVEYYGKREIKIRVIGKEAKDLLTIVIYELDRIHESFKRLRYSKLIPCNCDVCTDSTDQYFHNLDVLRKFVADRQETIQCQKSYQMVNVKELIDGVYRTTGDQVLVSYSHKDKQWLDQLQKILKPLTRSRQLSVWADTAIKPGANWKEEMQEALLSATVAVLLVSPDFLASDFIAEHELPPLLDAARRKGLTILWVAVSDSMYKETAIGDYQAANDPTKPLDSLSSAEANRVMVRVCEQIKEAANR
jgi:internalin A